MLCRKNSDDEKKDFITLAKVSWGHADARTGGEVIQVDNFVRFTCAEGTAQLVRF
jgi:hypothetical protein